MNGGTGSRSQLGAEFQIAGKTGTAQVFTVAQNEKYNEKELSERLHDHGLFVAFAPADAPRIAVAVIVENGKHGSTVAPIARRVMDQFLLGRTTTPESPPPTRAADGSVTTAPAAVGDE
jgi:penicillin-binding protein 2